MNIQNNPKCIREWKKVTIIDRKAPNYNNLPEKTF